MRMMDYPYRIELQKWAESGMFDIFIVFTKDTGLSGEQNAAGTEIKSVAR
jgi:hypothetical protein